MRLVFEGVQISHYWGEEVLEYVGRNRKKKPEGA